MPYETIELCPRCRKNLWYDPSTGEGWCDNCGYENNDGDGIEEYDHDYDDEYEEDDSDDY